MGARTTKALLAGAAAVALVAGGATAPAQAADKTIAFSSISWHIPYMVILQKAFNGAAKAQGFKTVNVPDNTFSPAVAKKNIESLITNKKINGFWSIAPGAPAALTTTVKLAMAKGVKAVVNGTPADYGMTGMQKGVSFAAIPYAKQGEALGTQLGQCLVKKNKATASIIMGENAAGTIGKSEFEAAFEAAFKKAAPKATIANHYELSGDAAAQQVTIRSAIQANPSSVGLVTWSDEGATGAIGAYKTAGKSAYDLCVVSGGSDLNFSKVNDGSLYAAVAVDGIADAKQISAELKRLISSPTATGKQLYTPVVIKHQ